MYPRSVFCTVVPFFNFCALVPVFGTIVRFLVPLFQFWGVNGESAKPSLLETTLLRTPRDCRDLNYHLVSATVSATGLASFAGGLDTFYLISFTMAVAMYALFFSASRFSTRFSAEQKSPQEYQILKNNIERFFVDVPCQGHYSTKTNYFCNARLLSCHGLAQIVTWKNGNESIPPVPLQALSIWNPARRSHTLHTYKPQVWKGNPFPIGEVLFVGVSPSVTTRPWWRNVW